MKDACLVCALMANIIVRSNVGMYNLIFYMLISLMAVWGFFFCVLPIAVYSFSNKMRAYLIIILLGKYWFIDKNISYIGDNDK